MRLYSEKSGILFRLTTLIIMLVLFFGSRVQAAEPIRWKLESQFPTSMPILGSLAKHLSKEIEKRTSGSIKIKVYEPGKLSSPFKLFESVAKGRIDAGWITARYLVKKNVAFNLFGGLPFGLSAMDHYAWIRDGGGLDLHDELFTRFNVKAIPSGMTGPEGLWFKKPIIVPSDLKGLYIRQTGFGVGIIKKLGAFTRYTPSGEIVKQFKEGYIDAADVGAPYIDKKMGIYKVAKYYYYPSWHQNVEMLDLIINKTKWNQLSRTQQLAIEEACHETVIYSIYEDERLAVSALSDLQRDGVSVQEFPPSITSAARQAWNELSKYVRGRNSDFGKMYSHYQAYNASINESKLAFIKKPEPIITEEKTEGVVKIASLDFSFLKSKSDYSNGIAVIIGNKNYKHKDIPLAKYSITDAQSVRSFLIDTMGYKKGNIIYKTDTTKTQMEMIFGIAENHNGLLNSYIKPNLSEVFIYYSGHGAPDVATNKAFFVPTDANPSMLALTGYPLDVFYKNLSKIKAKNINVVIEACFSGGTDPGILLVSNANPALINLSSPMKAMRSINVITSCEDNQVSSWYPDKGHSMFTYFFLKAVSGYADINKDRNLTYQELFNYVSDMAEGVPFWAKRLNAGRIQNPKLMCTDLKKVFVKY